MNQFNNQNSSTVFTEEEPQIDIKRLIFKYLRYKKWFIIGVFTTLLIAFLYNRYATDIYQTEAKIKILIGGDSAFQLDPFGFDGTPTMMSWVNLENEVEVLTSRRILDSVARSLKLNTVYFSEGRIKSSVLWKRETPFLVEWIGPDSALTKASPIFHIGFESITEFEIGQRDAKITQKAQLNDTIELSGYQFDIILNPAYKGALDEFKNKRYQFQYKPNSSIVSDLRGNIGIDKIGKKSDILKVSFRGANRGKNEAIINGLLGKYDQDGIRDRQYVSERTIEFLDVRLQLLAGELDTVESGLVDYKRSSGIVTLESSSQQLFLKESESQKKYYDLMTQREIAENFRDFIQADIGYNRLPANIGINNSAINSLTQRYNETIEDRELRLQSATEKNPVIISLNQRLDNLKQNILQSVSAYVRDLNQNLASFENLNRASAGALSQMPEKEKQMRGIQRQQQLKENLYLFLLQKREEAGMQHATTLPSIKVVDYAYTPKNPVAPKKQLIYLAGFVFGLLIPFGILYLKFIFDTRIEDKEDVHYNLPYMNILTEIPLVADSSDKLIAENDRSHLAEAFRVLRTNLSFIFLDRKETEEALTILVTSSIKGEGKTFTALNTAHTLAATGKKVLVLGCDMRNPQTHNYYQLTKEGKGLSGYLADKTLKLKDVVIKESGSFKNLDLVTAGSIPPNPAELLINGRFETLIKEARKAYDYIILDSPPTLLVADTLLISKFADVTIYLMRANYTDSKIVKHIKDMVNHEKLNKVNIVLNGVSEKTGYGYGYNYGYGYGYGQDVKKPWWKVWGA